MQVERGMEGFGSSCLIYQGSKAINVALLKKKSLSLSDIFTQVNSDECMLIRISWYLYLLECKVSKWNDIWIYLSFFDIDTNFFRLMGCQIQHIQRLPSQQIEKVTIFYTCHEVIFLFYALSIIRVLLVYLCFSGEYLLSGVFLHFFLLLLRTI